MPSKNKATIKYSKKGKAVKKTVTPTAPSDHESDWTSGEEEPSMKMMFSNLTAMMSSLSTCMDQVEGGGRKKRKVAFHSRAPTPETASPPDAAAAPTMHLPPSPPQPHGSQDGLALPPSVPQQPPLPGADHMHPEAPFQEGPHLICLICLRRSKPEWPSASREPHAPFLLTDEDSPTDEEASPTKRKRCWIKSGKLRTRDTRVLHKIKWPHEMVCSTQSKAPMYEMSLASFTNGYLGIVTEEGSPIREVMLRHHRALLQDVDVYGWKVVREYHAAWLQLLEQGWATWQDEGERAELRRFMVWSQPSFSSRFSHPPPTPVTSTGS